MTDRDQRAPSVQAARTVYCEQREGSKVENGVGLDRNNSS